MSIISLLLVIRPEGTTCSDDREVVDLPHLDSRVGNRPAWRRLIKRRIPNDAASIPETDGR
jgi:hypothetical protein